MSRFLYVLMLPAFLAFVENTCGQAITPLGTGIGTYGTINTMEYDSVNELLYVAGAFSYIDGVQAANIAVWNGKNWSALGLGTNGVIYSIKKIGGDLYVGGYFTVAGGIAANCIAKWDGSNWYALGGGVETGGAIFSISNLHDSVFVGGIFDEIDSVAAENLAYWSGNQWRPSGSGASDIVWHLQSLNDTLYASGWFTSINHVVDTAFAFYADGNWHSTAWNAAVGSWPFVINNNILYAEGDGYILHFSKGHWTSDFHDYNDELTTIGSFSDNLYIGGRFSDSVEIKKFEQGKLDSSIGGFVFNSFVPGGINCLFGTKLGLMIGGNYAYLNGMNILSLAAYDGSEIEAAGQVSGSAASNSNQFLDVRTLYKDSINNRVYVGGDFYTIGGLYSPNVGVWANDHYEALGSGLDSRVRKIVEYKGNIYACGDFVKSGSATVNHIAEWNGSNWINIGTGTQNTVYDLFVFNGYLYAAGDFISIRGVSVHDLAKFDGINWSDAGSSLFAYPVYCLNSYKNHLIAGTLNGPNGEAYMLDSSNQWNQMGTTAYGVLSFAVVDSTLFDVIFNGARCHVFEWNGVDWFDTNSPSYSDEGYARVFNIQNTLYFSNLNIGLYRYKSGKWKYISFVQPFTFAQKDDSDFYAGGFFPYTYLDISHFVEYNDIGVLQFSKPKVTIEVDTNLFCTHQYAFYSPVSYELDPKYYWHFPGGFPDSTSEIAPVVKYDSAGTFPVYCVVKNDVGDDTAYLSSPVTVLDCFITESVQAPDETLRVFPNPFLDQLSISTDQIKGISIFDEFGRNVFRHDFSAPISFDNINLNNLPRGLFLLEVQTSDRTLATKIIHR